MASKSQSDSRLMDAFGGLGRQIAGTAYGQLLGPELRGLGMGGGADFEARLANSNGPMAGLLKYLRQAEPQIMGQTNQLSAEAQNAIANIPNYREMLGQSADAARQYASEVMSPIESTSLYQNAMRDTLDATRAGAAARGTLDSGGAAQTEASTARNLGLGFAAQRRSEMANVPGILQNAASGQLQGIANQYNTRAGFQQMPLQLGSNLMSLNSFGLAPATQLTSATAPTAGQSTKGWGAV